MDAFLGEIRAFPFNFAPHGWATCNGQLLAISQNTALFSLLGTTYGGDGRVTFALPNLGGQIAIGQGQGNGLSPYALGEMGGVPTVTLTSAELAPHSHALPASNKNDAKLQSPGPTSYLGTTGQRGSEVNVYISQQGQVANPTTMLATAVGVAGGNQPHNNMAPYLVLTYCIAMTGVFPPRT